MEEEFTLTLTERIVIGSIALIAVIIIVWREIKKAKIEWQYDDYDAVDPEELVKQAEELQAKVKRLLKETEEELKELDGEEDFDDEDDDAEDEED